MYRPIQLFAVATLCAACGSSAMGPMVHDMDAMDAMTDEGAEAAAETGAGDGGSDATDGDAKPGTPTMTGVNPLGGALHVTWKLNDTALTSVELWRNRDAGAYAKAYTLAGTATSQHDVGATGTSTYCYKVKSFRGAIESDFSPEKCGKP